MEEIKAKVLGYYIKPNRIHPNKGITYEPYSHISPTLLAAMGGGGNIVPTILLYERNSVRNPDSQALGTGEATQENSR